MERGLHERSEIPLPFAQQFGYKGVKFRSPDRVVAVHAYVVILFTCNVTASAAVACGYEARSAE